MVKTKIITLVIAMILCLNIFCSVGCGNKPDTDKDNTDKDNIAEEIIDLTEEKAPALRNATDVDWLSYDEKFNSYPFFSDKQDEVTYAANAMYDMFTYITNPGGEAVYWFGSEPTWYEWMAVLTECHNNNPRKKQLRNYIIDRPICKNGFIWCWYDSPHWPTDNVVNGKTDDHYHYDQLFRYINGVYEVMKWENSTDLLDAKDMKLVEIADPLQQEHVSDDFSVGKTVLQKVEMAMDYILNVLNGKDGLVILGENANNGRNLGRVGDFGSNYWDNFLFGYLDGYENMLFYSSLISMEKIMTMCGRDTDANYYKELEVTAKQKFNETFWSDTAHRYIASIDVDGNKYDYGMTFMNMEAIHYGLADERQEKLIYTWLLGNRTIPGDRSTGKDIYKFKIAPRVTTFAMEDGPSATVDGRKQYWYFDWYGQANVNGSHSFGQHFENGGCIFYPEYYDLLNRIKIIGAESAMNRWKVLADEFSLDELNRRPPNDFGWTDQIGVIGEFPESGMIPVSWLTGFMGVNPDLDWINIKPSIPDEYEYMGMKDFNYGGKEYDIKVYKNGQFEADCKQGASAKYNIADITGKGTAKLTVYNGDEVLHEETLTAENGFFKVDLGRRFSRSQCRVEIKPV